MGTVTKFVFAAAALMVSVNASAKDDLPKASEEKPSAPKLICKTQLNVGSLVSRKKRCFTSNEWERISEAAQTGGRRLPENNAGIPAGEI